ncbi:MAG: HAMP domain-containing histidine kinase [Lachnospiraceae bacterium]|nr:HAMP domain-containing histidine kinase [Lachnospiraceae bacterium]
MKIRYIAVSYVVLLLGIMAVIYMVCKEENQASLDMVYYNGQLKQIEAGLSETVEKEELQRRFACKILYFADKDYETRLNEALRSQAVILDLKSREEIVGKVVWSDGEKLYEALKHDLMIKLEIVCGVILFAGIVFCFIFYAHFIAPFKRLQRFSGEIAKGNFDMPLPMNKNNFFGAFTESFDLLREELKRAKESEYQANRSKKELMAELSHDVKTPLSTIKATCEVLLIKEKNADTIEKINIIAAKAEVMDALVENLFQAAMEELEVLKVEPSEESSLQIKEILDELKFYGNIQIKGEIPECLVYMDKLRLSQVLDNVVSNSNKYAGTAIDVSFVEEREGILIRLRDYGQGISEEELSCVTEKYYRGSNTKGKTGSGLGLYLADMFMERMHGGMECSNICDQGETGFRVTLFLKKV